MSAFDAIVFIMMPALFIIHAIIFFYYDHKTGVVTATSRPEIRKRMIELIREDFTTQRQSGYRGEYALFDLGSGYGEVAWQIAKEFPEIKVIGCEISPIPFLGSIIRQKIFFLPNLSYKRGDFLSIDLHHASAVVLYLSTRAVNVSGISDKLYRELPEGALVLSNTFPLHQPWHPIAEENITSPFNSMMKFYVYRKNIAST